MSTMPEATSVVTTGINPLSSNLGAKSLPSSTCLIVSLFLNIFIFLKGFPSLIEILFMSIFSDK